MSGSLNEGVFAMKEEIVKKVVREGYAQIAQAGGPCCLPSASCCGGVNLAAEISKKIGYADEDLKSVPEGANLGLGCGNPLALASLKEGETVLDLGSGAGFDCFLAANQVGKSGRVIGVDMTPEMVQKARENAGKGGYGNVEFRLGEIENLPVADRVADAIISNCVINLAPDKGRVFREAFRALKPGGRLMVSDIVLRRPLPDFIMNSIAAYVGCISGAVMQDEYLHAIEQAGFRDVRIMEESLFPIDCMANDPTAQAIVAHLDMPPEKILEAVEGTIASVKVHAVKPD
jgi:arsenite methyltransferase